MKVFSPLIRIVLLHLLIIVVLTACSPSSKYKKFMRAEDEAVLELVESIRKNSADKRLWEQLPDVYNNSMDSRERDKEFVLRDNASGDRWVLWANQLEASKYITETVMKLPGASSYITNPRYYSAEIDSAKENAADEYYRQGMEYMLYNNRPYAQKALDMFQKANRAKPGYLDVNEQIRKATLLAQMVVMVNPVDYYNFGWNSWGLNNDYVQWQMVNDLNRQSWSNVRFYTNEEVRSLRLHPERVVDMRFVRLDVYSPYTERYQYERTANIPISGGIRPDSTRPAFQVVKATVFVTRREIRGEADLVCNVYDQVTSRSIYSDHFPGRYQWEQRSATYSGDRRALTDEDWRLINNRMPNDPGRNEIARRLIEDSYQQLISRIQQAVNFNAY